MGLYCVVKRYDTLPNCTDAALINKHDCIYNKFKIICLFYDPVGEMLSVLARKRLLDVWKYPRGD